MEQPINNFTLIDSDILIDAGRGIREAVTCLQEIEESSALAISVITQMELIVGCQSKAELRTLERFLRRFQTIQLSAPISAAAIKLLRRYRLSHGLLIADSLIAATALALNQPFISKNQRHYQFISGLHLLPYPQPYGIPPKG